VACSLLGKDGSFQNCKTDRREAQFFEAGEMPLSLDGGVDFACHLKRKARNMTTEVHSNIHEDGGYAPEDEKGVLFWVETKFEQSVFAARWMMAPMYVGLGLTMLMMLFVFAKEILKYATELPGMTTEDVILATLTLIDLTLAANLVIVVLFAGYENFVSKMHLKAGSLRPSWMGKVDFSGLKMKLIASMVAISGIHLLKTFMSLSDPAAAVNETQMYWLVVFHLCFCISGVLLAGMDWMASKTKKDH